MSGSRHPIRNGQAAGTEPSKPDGGSGTDRAPKADFVRVTDLRKRFGELEVLRGINLTIDRGERVAIIGSSGSGKTTLLRCLNMLEEFEAGEIHIEGEPIGYKYDTSKRTPTSPSDRAKLRRKIGMVFQSFNLFPHASVIENVTMAPIHVNGQSKDEARSNGLELLEMVGLADKADNPPSSLSGGQQQRVAIARALAMDPKMMLFDEVTSALDPELVGEVLSVMKDLAESGMTMAVVTHELHFARDVADRVLFFNEGLIEESGDPEKLFGDPQSPALKRFVARFTENYFLD